MDYGPTVAQIANAWRLNVVAVVAAAVTVQTVELLEEFERIWMNCVPVTLPMV